MADSKMTLNIEKTPIDVGSQTASTDSTIVAQSPLSRSKDDLDQAYWYIRQAGAGINDEVATPAASKALRRKIDRWIVPISFACYTMQFLDKVLLNVGDRVLLPRSHG